MFRDILFYDILGEVWGVLFKEKNKNKLLFLKFNVFFFYGNMLYKLIGWSDSYIMD